MADTTSAPKSFYRYITSPMYTIVAGKEATEFRVHSALLSEKSPTFRALIDGFKWSESSEQRVVWEDWPVDTVYSFVEWLYTGEYECVFPRLAKQYGKKEEDLTEHEIVGVGAPKDGKPKTNAEEEVEKHWSEVLRDREEAHQKSLSQLKSKVVTNGDKQVGGTAISKNAEAAWKAAEEMRADLEKTILKQEESTKAAAALATRMQSKEDEGNPEELSKQLLKELAECSAEAAAVFRDRKKKERNLAELENLAKEADKAIIKDDRISKGTRLHELLKIEGENRLKRLQDEAEVDTKRMKEYLAFLKQPLKKINLLTVADLKQTSQLERFHNWLGFSEWLIKDIDFEAPMLRHASVYVLAEYTQIPDLQRYAFRALQVALGKIQSLPENAIGARNFVALTQYVFENIDRPQEPLREMLTRYAAWNHVNLLPIDEYKWLLDAGGDFVTSLSANLAKRLVR